MEEIKNILVMKKQIVLYGVPGVGKSKFIFSIENSFDFETGLGFLPLRIASYVTLYL